MRDDPPAERPFGLPLPEEYGRLEHVHSTNSPDVGDAVAALRAAAGDAPLVGEVYLPAADRGPYLEHLDVAFAFELLHAPWEAGALRARDRGQRGRRRGLGAVQPRLPARAHACRRERTPGRPPCCF